MPRESTRQAARQEATRTGMEIQVRQDERAVWVALSGILDHDGVAALAGRVFVAHNVRFDWSFVDAELRRNRGLSLDGPRLCTVKMSRRLIHGLTSHALDHVTAHFNLDNGSRHRAAGDALVTAEILRRLLAMAVGQGANTLDDLEQLLSRRTR